MSAEDRQQIIDSARYLRDVRPLDPMELAEYVDGGLHPAVVKQILREEALDLGLVETGDGTFIPAPEGPIEPTFSGVSALPEAYDRRLADCLVAAYGPDWHTGESGNRLRNRLAELKRAYFGGESVSYDRLTAHAYAVYHLGDFYAASQYVYHELGGDGRLDPTLRVLDVGAGVGGPALGLHDYVLGPPEDTASGPTGRIEYHGLEPGSGTEILEELLGETRRNFRWTVTSDRVEEFEPDHEYDLILFGNVISELETPVATAGRALDWLASGGSLVATAPADLETATGLRAVERELVAAETATVYAPTTWCWPDRHPSDRGWSFDRRQDIAVPPVMERLATAGPYPDEVRNVDVKFAYSLLNVDGRRRHDVALDTGRVLPLAEGERAVTERVDLVVAKLSRDLAESNSGPISTANPVYKIGDGSEDIEWYAVHVHESALNEALRTAGYGALLSLENALVLWNDDEAAYNVVVDEEALVDVVGRGADDIGAP